MCLPPEAGIYANNVLRLERSIHGLKSVVKDFMKQIGGEVMKFVERVDPMKFVERVDPIG